MEKLCFNLGWKVRNGISNPFDAIFQGGAAGEPVTLPQDAMVLEARDPDCAAKNQAGYYPAKTYTYTKTFFVPEDWAEKTNVIEFEGVMAQAQVFLNNQFLACHKYGYSSFSLYSKVRKRFEFVTKSGLFVCKISYVFLGIRTGKAKADL